MTSCYKWSNRAMKKFILPLMIFACSFSVFAQNEFGAFAFPSQTAINNSANSNVGDIFTQNVTFSGGAGVYFRHFLFDKGKGRNRFHHGRRVATFQNRWAVKTGLMYAAHNQSFTSIFNTVGSEPTTHIGKKRLDYVKAFVWLEHSYPLFHLNKINGLWYVGLQGSYLLKADGGIVTWSLRDDGTTAYFDLPPSDRGYFKSFIFESAIGTGVEYHLTKWINLNFLAHADLSITTVENNDALLFNIAPEAHGGPSGVYDRRLEPRGNSRNSTIAFIIGVGYTFHTPEFHRAKY